MYYVMDSRIVPQMHLADYWILKPPCAHKKRVPHEYIAYLIQKGELYLAEDGITYHLHQAILFFWILINIMRESRLLTANIITFIFSMI